MNKNNLYFSKIFSLNSTLILFAFFTLGCAKEKSEDLSLRDPSSIQKKQSEIDPSTPAIHFSKLNDAPDLMPPESASMSFNPMTKFAGHCYGGISEFEVRLEATETTKNNKVQTIRCSGDQFEFTMPLADGLNSLHLTALDANGKAMNDVKSFVKLVNVNSQQLKYFKKLYGVDQKLASNKKQNSRSKNH